VPPHQSVGSETFVEARREIQEEHKKAAALLYEIRGLPRCSIVVLDFGIPLSETNGEWIYF
jgi:hypothetical protein